MPKIDPVTGLKICSKCRKEGDRSLFSADSSKSDGLSAQCKECARTLTRNWAKRNNGKVVVANRRDRLKRMYGITQEDYDHLLESQGGVCAICQETCSVRAQLCIDHSHTSGRVRGLLCARCNQMLGLARERPDILQAALRYLEAYIDV